MNYLTVEVEIRDGNVVPKDASQLPEQASGLLAILESFPTRTVRLTPLQALEALQKHLQLEQNAAQQWMAIVREGRR